MKEPKERERRKKKEQGRRMKNDDKKHLECQKKMRMSNDNFEKWRHHKRKFQKKIIKIVKKHF